ncbi:hypothetical protein Tsubulata_004884 [Turnera subulata]|uniref:KIB1-4 beta-propeller domain-containing protein n=1 Tax=Turnera subulata TaxID=218843 RepID=A0A9Q0JHT1_9ROSI|nr:hypothetical protein Tsubulata_004884 [Turnera subulata]
MTTTTTTNPTGITTITHQWADLPRELLQLIGKHLDSRIDVYRFRAICTSWRSSVPLLPHNQFPLRRRPLYLSADAFLSPVTICRVESAHLELSAASSSPAVPSRPWLTKVLESTQGEKQLLIPLSNYQITTLPGTTPKSLDLLRFRLVELTRAYMLVASSARSVSGVSKVVVFPDYVVGVEEECVVLAIFPRGKLYYWRYGDQDWTLSDKGNHCFHDIIVYKGQLYVIDRSGTVYWIDSSLNIVQYSPLLYGCGGKKNLVESCGDLYVVDRYFEGSRRYDDIDLDNDDFYGFVAFCPDFHARTVDVKVYRLDEEWGTWVDVKCLGDRIFVLGSDCCFSVSAKEFAGCEGNSIYFTDQNYVDFQGEPVSAYETRVFSLGNRKVAHPRPSSNILRPPPIPS